MKPSGYTGKILPMEIPGQRNRYTAAALGSLAMLVVIFIAVGLMLTSCRKPSPMPTWSIYIYLDGDNDLSNSAVADLLEMAAVGSSDRITIVVQIDRLGETAKRYRIVPGGWELLADLGELDMASPQTIQDFLVWAGEMYPADRKVLILWNHGNGWDQGDGPSSPAAPLRNAGKAQRSILYDDDNGMGGASPFLSNHVVKQAIETSNISLDILGLDASIMGTFEALYEFKDLAPILISSQEVGESHGWDYTAIFSNLVRNPGMSTEDLSRVIVDSYGNFFENSFYPLLPAYEKRHSIAAIRTAYLGPLATEIDGLAVGLTGRLNDPAMKDAALTTIGTARLSVQEIDKYNQPYVYVDLMDLDRLLNQGTVISQLLTGATIAEYHGTARPNAHGLSIVFFRFPEAIASNTFDSNYKNYDAATNTGNSGDFINFHLWDEFLATYYSAAGV